MRTHQHLDDKLNNQLINNFSKKKKKNHQNEKQNSLKLVKKENCKTQH